MSDKSTWKKVRFGEVVSNVIIQSSRFPSEKFCNIVGLENMESGSLHIPAMTTVNSSQSFTKVFRSRQTLFGKRRSYQKKIAIAEYDGLCSGDILVFDTKDANVMDRDLIPFICASNQFHNFVLSNSQGSLSPRVSFKALESFEFLLPPFEEQKHIAEILWAADDVVQKHTAVRNNIRTVKMLLLDGLCEILSANNNIIQLGDVIEYKSGQVDPKVESYKSMPLIAPNHIEGGTGKIIKIESAEQQNAISGKYLFEAGDVVYSKIRPSLNKVFMASFEGLCSADMYPLKVKSPKITSNFLYYLLTSNKFVEYATVCSVRTSIPKLNRTDMSKFEFYCPNKKQQDLFLKKMHSCEDSLDQINQQIANSQEVLFALIDNYLGGAN